MTPAGILVSRGAMATDQYAQDLALYQTTCERQFYRAIRTLIRLPEIRFGEFSPHAVLEYDGG